MPVEVGSESNVIDASDVADVVDVVGDLGDGGDGRRVRFEPRSHLRVACLLIVTVRSFESSGFGVGRRAV